MTNFENIAGRTIRVDNVEQAIPVVITYITMALAGAGIAGHDMSTVCARMTTDKVMDTIRTAYTYRTDALGDTPKEAVVSIGVRLIEAYRVKYGI